MRMHLMLCTLNKRINFAPVCVNQFIQSRVLPPGGVLCADVFDSLWDWSSSLSVPPGPSVPSTGVGAAGAAGLIHPKAALARGMGQYYEGSGVFNKKTAMADAINVDTMIRWNEYLYEAHLEATRRLVARRRANSERIRGACERDLKDLLENPSARHRKRHAECIAHPASDPRISTSGAEGRRPARSKPARHPRYPVPQRVRSSDDRPLPGQGGDQVAGRARGERFATEKRRSKQIVDKARTGRRRRRHLHGYPEKSS